MAAQNEVPTSAPTTSTKTSGNIRDYFRHGRALIRVLMLTSTLPRFPGDMQANFVGEQAEAWSKARPNARLHILAPHDKSAPLREDHGRISIERYRYMWPEGWQNLAYPAILPNIRHNPALALLLPQFMLAQLHAATRIVKRETVDLIYAHWVMPQGLVAWRLKQKLGIPYVVQNHSSDLSVFEKLGRPGRKLARQIIRDATHFFCVNSMQRDFAASLFEGGERDEFLSRCSVIPMGVVLPDPAAGTRREYEIATIGRLSAKKGVHYLIGASERLAAEGKHPVIGIAGDGEEFAALKAMVLDADIRFLGFVSALQKDDFFERAARFAFPAKAADGDVEGLPVSLLEALCRGMPVLATRDTNIELLPEWPRLREFVVFVPEPSNLAALQEGLTQLLSMPPTPNQDLVDLMARYRWERLIEAYLNPIEASASTLAE